VGKAADLASVQVHRARYSMREKDAWRAMARTGILYVFSNDGTETEYTVLDATCTHAACNVHWKEEKNQFCCPCHDGCFSREGEVLSGPPTRPLRRLQTKIEAGVLFALI
jgi:Rieske Fe-S protein